MDRAGHRPPASAAKLPGRSGRCSPAGERRRRRRRTPEGVPTGTTSRREHPASNRNGADTPPGGAPVTRPADHRTSTGNPPGRAAPGRLPEPTGWRAITTSGAGNFGTPACCSATAAHRAGPHAAVCDPPAASLLPRRFRRGRARTSCGVLGAPRVVREQGGAFGRGAFGAAHAFFAVRRLVDEATGGALHESTAADLDEPGSR